MQPWIWFNHGYKLIDLMEEGKGLIEGGKGLVKGKEKQAEQIAEVIK